MKFLIFLLPVMIVGAWRYYRFVSRMTTANSHILPTNISKETSSLKKSILSLRLYVNIRTLDIPHTIVVENTDELSAYEVLWEKLTQHQYIRIDPKTYLNTDAIVRIEIVREEILK